MADMNTLLSNSSSAVATSTAISAWALAAYGRACTVYENADLRELPGEENCPLIIVYPLNKNAGLSGEKKGHGIGVSAWVFDDSKPVDVAGVVRFEGARNAEELRKLALVEIVPIVKAMGLQVMDVETVYDPIALFPLASADMAIKITETKLCGRNPYE